MVICRLPIILIVDLNYLFNKGFYDKRGTYSLRMEAKFSVVRSQMDFQREALDYKVNFSKSKGDLN